MWDGSSARGARCWHDGTRTSWRALLGAVAGVWAAGCQILFGYDAFEPSLEQDAAPPPHPCAVLPASKSVETWRGPIVARVDLAAGDCVWMDQTEVTVGDYGEWIEALAGAAPDWEAASLGGNCAWKTEPPSQPATDPTDACRQEVEDLAQQPQPTPFQLDKPIRCVDWCDAKAYCAWANKRLCFGFDGVGLLVPTGKFDWDAACSLMSTREFPYGSEYDARACNTDQSNPAQGCVASGGSNKLCGPTPVEYLPDCRASPTSPSDLSGNVSEWIDLCVDGLDAETSCHRRGGSYADGPEDASCRAVDAAARSDRRPSVGFRCCADLSAAEKAALQNQLP